MTEPLSREPLDPVDEMRRVIEATLNANALRLTTTRGGYVGGGQPHATLASDPGAVEAVARGMLARQVAEPSREPLPVEGTGLRTGRPILTLLNEAMSIIETADNRAMAADGPVSHVRDEMSDAEWRALYVALTKARDALSVIVDREVAAALAATQPETLDVEGTGLRQALDGLERAINASQWVTAGTRLAALRAVLIAPQPETLRLAMRAAVVALPQPTLGLAGGVNRGAVIDAIDAVFAAALSTPDAEAGR